MQLLLNLVSRLFGLDLEFNFWGVFLFLVAVVIPVYAMVQCALIARRQRRPVAWVALMPICVWVIPRWSFILRAEHGIKWLPLLGIAVGCVGFIAVFFLVGASAELDRSQQKP